MSTEEREAALRAAGVRARSWKTYAGRLFNNIYNYTLLAGVTSASAMTGEWWLLALGLGAEALWMVYAPDSKIIRKQVDKVLDEEAIANEIAARNRALMRLSSDERMRCLTLLSKQDEIEKLAADNPSFGTSLLSQELDKLHKLTESFIELSLTSARYLDHLDKESIGEVERQRRIYEKEIEHGKGPAVDLAKKNLDVVMRRIERLREINDFVVRARRQMELIENSFALLADQIVSMRSPSELSGQLDELIDGVEAVRETAKEADKLMQGTALGSER
jgi:acetolactate synthase regulatory subunit